MRFHNLGHKIIETDFNDYNQVATDILINIYSSFDWLF